MATRSESVVTDQERNFYIYSQVAVAKMISLNDDNIARFRADPDEPDFDQDVNKAVFFVQTTVRYVRYDHSIE